MNSADFSHCRRQYRIGMRVMTSPSSYPASAVPVVPSAVSSARVSPEPIGEVYSPGIIDVFLTYKPSPDTSMYGDSCTPGGSCAALGHWVSLAGGGGGPVSMDGLFAGDLWIETRICRCYRCTRFRCPRLDCPPAC